MCIYKDTQNNLKNRNFNKAGTPDLQQRDVAEAGHVRDTWPMEATAKVEMPAKLKPILQVVLCIRRLSNENPIHQ